jgi:alpha-L-fucosidase
MKIFGIIFAAAIFSASAQASKPPVIVKKGTVDLDLCETTPFVFKDKLYRLEWHRKAGRLRIMDHDTQLEIGHFGEKHRFPCAFVEGDTVYVIGTSEDKGWCGTTLTLYTSKDLTNWNERVAYQNPEFRMCNTSVCKADGRYVMSVELAVGGFMGRFLESKDLVHWTLMPADCKMVGAGSPHLIRWHAGWFYVFSTKGGHPKGYVLLLKRSRDLKT